MRSGKEDNDKIATSYRNPKYLYTLIKIFLSQTRGRSSVHFHIFRIGTHDTSSLQDRTFPRRVSTCPSLVKYTSIISLKPVIGIFTQETFKEAL